MMNTWYYEKLTKDIESIEVALDRTKAFISVGNDRGEDVTRWLLQEESYKRKLHEARKEVKDMLQKELDLINKDLNDEI